MVGHGAPYVTNGTREGGGESELVTGYCDYNKYLHASIQTVRSTTSLSSAFNTRSNVWKKSRNTG